MEEGTRGKDQGMDDQEDVTGGDYSGGRVCFCFFSFFLCFHHMSISYVGWLVDWATMTGGSSVVCCPALLTLARRGARVHIYQGAGYKYRHDW